MFIIIIIIIIIIQKLWIWRTLTI